MAWDPRHWRRPRRYALSDKPYRQNTVTNPNKDRTLRGKKRIKARRQSRQAS